MAASALRADSTLSPTLVRTNTQCSFEFVLAFFTFKVFADKSKTLQWCLVLYLFLFSQERLFPGSKSFVVPQESPEKGICFFKTCTQRWILLTVHPFTCYSICSLRFEMHLPALRLINSRIPESCFYDGEKAFTFSPV